VIAVPVTTDVTLQTLRLSRRFGSRTAVAGLNLTAHAGEVVGLLGPNGAGKTTVMRVLTTILAPSQGQYWVDGVPASRPDLIRSRIGVLPESIGYPAHTCGCAYLRYFARLSGQTRSQATDSARRLLAEVELSEDADRPVGSYSRGMRQRLGLARALINDPAVLFLDEPTLGLDPAGNRRMLAQVRDITSRRGVTVLLSSHSLADIESICDQVLVLNRGRAVISGAVADVVAAATLPGVCRVRVRPDQTALAATALGHVSGLEVSGSGGSGGADPDGLITVTPTSRSSDLDDRQIPGDVISAALRALLDHDVTVVSFHTEGFGLTEAFLRLTEPTGPTKPTGPPEPPGPPGPPEPPEAHLATGRRRSAGTRRTG
jgi:ABC-2 type transport system ATP-binding protein